MIYLDNAATTKPKKEVIDAMMPYLKVFWHNPSSLYKPSTFVKHEVEKARDTVAKFIGANSNEIFFTSGGSESNCWAIQGFVKQCKVEKKHPIVITSVIEHKSILDCVEDITAHFINVDNKGLVNINELKELLEKISEYNIHSNVENKVLVSIQYANNEIGTIQQIEEISELVHKYDGIFHTDAVQAFGQLPIHVEESGIDMLSASGHKIGTPKGIGILYKKNGINIRPIIYGSQMDGMRGGTENVPYIIAMAKAVNLLDVSEEYRLKMSNIRNYFMNMLMSKIGCKINGSTFFRLPNNINVTFPKNITGEALLYILEMCSIFISTGSACNSHSNEPSHVLKAIGLSDEESMKTIRISLSEDITNEQIDNVICEMEKQIKLLEME